MTTFDDSRGTSLMVPPHMMMMLIIMLNDDGGQVAEAIHRRIREGSRPGNRTDGMKIGLALEGGE